MSTLTTLFLLLIVWYFVSTIVLPIAFATSDKEDRQEWYNFLWKRLNVYGKIFMYFVYLILVPAVTIILTFNYLFTVKKEPKE